MCGIYGSTKIFTEEIIKQKLGLMDFRGPDNSHYVVYNNKVILGHNRLAIIDLEERSNQPLEYNHLSITFNGEIYNYEKLKKKLQASGYSFKTNSDTEVILALYLKYQNNCLFYLNGMFSFVIFDSKNNHLFGARDRFGQKPFYYSHKDGEFEFASQISSLKYGNNYSINDESVSQYFLWNYIPEPSTIYHEVKKLEAGNYFIYNLKTKEFTKDFYWDLKKTPTKYKGSYSEAKEELYELITDATKIRMISDVPLGVFLSGGIDSSLISSIASKSSNAQIRTYCVKFNEKEFDESKYALQVANHICSSHTEILCDMNEGLKLIEDYSKYYDEPFSDSSAIPSLLLSLNTRKHVTVALSGDAGDEAFMGYDRYRWMIKSSIFYKNLSPFRNIMAAILARSPSYRHKKIALGLQSENLNLLYKNLMTGVKFPLLNNSGFIQNKNYDQFLFTDKSLLERISDYDIKTYLNGDINTKVDRASMAYSLESRSPLQDYRVIDFARTLPVEYKYTKHGGKRILKDMLYDLVPKEIFNRPKSGFSIPLNLWFKNELKDYVLDNLNQNFLKVIPNLNVKLAEKYIRNHMAGNANHSDIIWSLLVYKNWLYHSSNL